MKSLRCPLDGITILDRDGNVSVTIKPPFDQNPDAFDDCYPNDAISQDDGEEYADSFACDSPRGHAAVTSCGFTKCIYCGLVFWS